MKLLTIKIYFKLLLLKLSQKPWKKRKFIPRLNLEKMGDPEKWMTPGTKACIAKMIVTRPYPMPPPPLAPQLAKVKRSIEMRKISFLSAYITWLHRSKEWVLRMLF